MTIETIYRRIFYNNYRKIKNLMMRKRLLNRDFTLISDNCVAGMIYHDLGLEFKTPTINLFFMKKDFIKFLKNLDFYLSQELSDFSFDRYPVGLLYDIKIHFLHYKSFQEAKEKWEARKSRMNLDNLFIFASQRDSCSDEDLYDFDKLPYKNKIILTTKSYSLKSSLQIKKFKKEKEVGVITTYRDYEKVFDLIHWLNTGEIIIK
ncbi:MAG: DUF1919 domain-containing protein [Spirochaetales bacterium]|nr:DUF1919 domain-containing protein [Spirochaetales bacterium]